jgi:predicted nucleic acid-binding protein
MISTFTVVLDANVLFGSRLTSLLMELAMSGLFRARWSDHIHEEWMAAVSAKYGIPRENLTRRRDFMNASVPDACVTGYEDLIGALVLPDPKDRHVLAAAIRCGASAIVTFNEKDFPADAITKFGIHTRHPDDFILEVDGIDPGTLADAARHDLTHYKNPPLSVDDYIQGLRDCALPKTAEYLDKTRVLLTS